MIIEWIVVLRQICSFMFLIFANTLKTYKIFINDNCSLPDLDYMLNWQVSKYLFSTQKYRVLSLYFDRKPFIAKQYQNTLARCSVHMYSSIIMKHLWISIPMVHMKSQNPRNHLIHRKNNSSLFTTASVYLLS